MKVKAWYEPEPCEVEAEVTFDDVQAMISELTEREGFRATIGAASYLIKTLQAIPDESIEQVGEAIRKEASRLLHEEAKRWSK